MLLFISWPLVLLIGTWVIWLIYHGPADETLETARCARCGYATRGMSGWQCPECGADLREVGVLPPNKKRGHPDKKILWFAGFWAIGTILLVLGLIGRLMISPYS